MTQIFTSKNASLFVGGRGTKAGEANAGGGCTQAFWDSANNDMSLVMGTNGGMLSVGTWNGSSNACTTQNSGGNLRIDKVGGFTNCSVGLLCYIDMTFDPNYLSYDHLRYEVLTVDDDYIVIDLPYQGSSPNTDCKVGGSFSDKITALNVVASPEGTITNIYDNLDEVLTGSLSPTGKGDIAEDAHVVMWAFKTYPGDCDKGGPCYQNPLDAFVNGVDLDCKVDVDANDGAFDILVLDGTDCVTWKNYYFHNTSGAGNDAIAFLNQPILIGFINCVFDDVNDYMTGSVTGAFTVRDCLFTSARNTSPVFPGAAAGGFSRCVFDGTGMNWAWGTSYEHYWDCLFIGGTYGINSVYYTNLQNCVFYNQTTSCIYLNSAAQMILGFNNVFAPAAISDYVITMGENGGAVSVDLEKSCVYSIGNGPLTAMINNTRLSKTYDLPGTVIEEDPLFRNAANYDFRLKAESPVLNQGMWTQGGMI
jgi:hypothetical protein